MGTNSKIEWTDHTWNPWRGCTKVSPACDNCYMFRDAKHYGLDATTVTRAAPQTFRAPLVQYGSPWHGKRRAEKRFKWQDGEKVFVCSWSDFFHPDADPWRDEAWEIMRQRPGLVFQLLTKRPDLVIPRLPEDWGEGWPNIWLGVTAENQEQADKRIPRLLETPAALRFVSIEPMLGPVDLTRLDYFRSFNEKLSPMERAAAPALKWNALSDDDGYNDAFAFQTGEELALLDWVIVGGESGPQARPVHPDWVRTIRDQCQQGGVPFMFKQWGEWLPKTQGGRYVTGRRWGVLAKDGEYIGGATTWNGRQEDGEDGECSVFMIGKNNAGSLLDGHKWKGFPE